MSRGGMMPIIATTTIAVSIFVLGIFLLLSFNLNNVMKSLHSKLDIIAYVDAAADKVTVDTINIQISKVAGVKKFDFISKEEAWQQMRESYNNLKLEEIVDNNPLPDAFKIEVTSLNEIKSVADMIRSFEGVEEVRYGGDIAERIELFTRYLSFAGIILIALLVIATIMIIFNTIRLTVLARENELNIMSLVGATKSFIKKPFVLEGLYMGMIASFVAIVCLKLFYNVAVMNIEKNLPFLPLNLSGGEINMVFVIVFITGILLGVFGGYFSVTNSLKAEI